MRRIALRWHVFHRSGEISLPRRTSRPNKELRARQDELGKVWLQLLAEVAAHGATHVDADIVKSYAKDLKGLLKEADITESKAFIRSFIKRIEINKSEAIIHYNLPVPQYWGEKQSAGVLPIDNLGGPNITFAKPIETFFELSIGSAPPSFGGQNYEPK